MAIAASSRLCRGEAKGRDWPPDPAATPTVTNPSLYAGTPGVVLFFLELARATGDRSYLETGSRGRDGLSRAAPDDDGIVIRSRRWP